MLKEALDRLREMAKKEMEVRHFHLPGDPPHIRYIAKPDGTYQQVRTEIGERIVTSQTLHGVLDQMEEPFDPDAVRKPRLFVSQGWIELVLDSGRALERVQLELTKSSQYDLMETQREAPTLTVPQARQCLKFELDGAWQHTSPKLLDLVSNLASVTRSDRETRMERSKETFGQTVNAQVQQDTPLPEELQTFDIRPWAVPDMKVTFPLVCRLEPDLQTNQWQLRPTDASWQQFHEAAFQYLLETCRARADGTGVQVVQGVFANSHAEDNLHSCANCGE